MYPYLNISELPLHSHQLIKAEVKRLLGFLLPFLGMFDNGHNLLVQKHLTHMVAFPSLLTTNAPQDNLFPPLIEQKVAFLVLFVNGY